MAKEKVPHTAIITIKVEVQDILDSGECSGTPMNGNELRKAGIAPTSVITISGFDKFDCLQKLKEKLNDIQTK